MHTTLNPTKKKTGLSRKIMWRIGKNYLRTHTTTKRAGTRPEQKHTLIDRTAAKGPTWAPIMGIKGSPPHTELVRQACGRPLLHQGTWAGGDKEDSTNQSTATAEPEGR
jgi:hypothetical protein